MSVSDYSSLCRAGTRNLATPLCISRSSEITFAIGKPAAGHPLCSDVGETLTLDSGVEGRRVVDLSVLSSVLPLRCPKI
jgi:hypothetical protein